MWQKFIYTYVISTWLEGDMHCQRLRILEEIPVSRGFFLCHMIHNYCCSPRAVNILHMLHVDVAENYVFLLSSDICRAITEVLKQPRWRRQKRNLTSSDVGSVFLQHSCNSDSLSINWKCSGSKLPLGKAQPRKIAFQSWGFSSSLLLPFKIIQLKSTHQVNVTEILCFSQISKLKRAEHRFGPKAKSRCIYWSLHSLIRVR